MEKEIEKEKNEEALLNEDIKKEKTNDELNNENEIKSMQKKIKVNQ